VALVLNLARRYSGELYRGADHVGWPLLAAS
jgi:hypothetical protein